MAVDALFHGWDLPRKLARETPRESKRVLYDSDEERSIERVGGSYSSWWQIRRRALQEECGRELRRAKTTRSLFGTAAKPAPGRDARELERTSAELVSDQECSRLLSRERERTDLGHSFHNPTATRERGAGRKRGRRNERSEEAPGRGNEYFSRAKTGPPAEAIEGVVKTHRSFRLLELSQGELRREPKKRRARVQLVR